MINNNLTINKIADALNIAKDNKVDKKETTFGDVLDNAIKEVNQYQKDSSAMKDKLILGELDNLHDPMIASEKANVTLQFSLKVYGKVMDAYKEIMRMQV